MALTKADVAGGGTGATSLTDHGVLLGSGTGAVSVTSAGTSGQVLTSGGSGADPDWAAAAAGGITDWDQWRLTTNFATVAGVDNLLSTNLERTDTNGFSVLGTGMTHSLGLFTFPATGYWKVEFQSKMYASAVSRSEVNLYYTDDDWATESVVSQGHLLPRGTDALQSPITGSLFYITDLTNQEIKFKSKTTATGTVYGDTNFNVTYMNFIRLG